MIVWREKTVAARIKGARVFAEEKVSKSSSGGEIPGKGFDLSNGE